MNLTEIIFNEKKPDTIRLHSFEVQEVSKLTNDDKIQNSGYYHRNGKWI